MKVDVKMWNVMRDRERWLRAWIRSRDYQVEKEQKDFLLFFYCTLRKIKDKKYALKALYNMNQRFPNPLSNEQLTKKVILLAEQKEIEKAHVNIVKVQRIIEEFRSTLDRRYAVSEDFDRVYVYLLERLLQANVRKDAEILNEVNTHLRSMRDTWKEVMRINKEKH